jgi:hypothetical protein
MLDPLVGGTETVVVFSVFILLPAYLVPLFGFMAPLVGMSIVQRLAWAKGALSGHSGPESGPAEGFDLSSGKTLLR